MADPYRLLITGSRDWADQVAVRSEIAAAAMLHPGLVVVHGAHRTGADAMAAKACQELGVRQEPHPANWKRDGRAAGPRRNAEMVTAGAGACIAFLMPCADSRCTRPRPHDSHGASDCAGRAEAAGIPVMRVRPGSPVG